MQHWLLVRGRGGRRLRPEVRPEELRAHASTRRPSIRAGDRAVLYAAGWQVVFGVADVVTDPEEDPARTRWRWHVEIRPELALHDLREAPPVQAAGVLTSSLGRHSYIRLAPEQFAAGRRAVAAAIVAAAYDDAVDRFVAWQGEFPAGACRRRIERLLSGLPPRPAILELGVGAGNEASVELASRGVLTGVDVSAGMLARARSRLPGVRLLQSDVLELELPEASFDAVVALYVLNHVLRDELGPLFHRIARWLRPGGCFLASLGARDTPTWSGEWLGAPTIFSGYPPEVNERLLREAGLELVESSVEATAEPGHGEVPFHWVLARRPD
ncbi:MAG: class I SAM-dependent DNA methyltransferase [Pseudomonadota bacterium]